MRKAIMHINEIHTNSKSKTSNPSSLGDSNVTNFAGIYGDGSCDPLTRNEVVSILITVSERIFRILMRNVRWGKVHLSMYM